MSVIQRDVYVLPTSPSGCARPLGEVVKTYTSLKRVDGFDFRVAFPCVAAALSPVAQSTVVMRTGLLSNRRAACYSARLYAFRNIPGGLHTVVAMRTIAAAHFGWVDLRFSRAPW